jgi:hypothetical protein
MSIASDGSEQEVYVRPPSHPVPTLQGPFEESMVESVDSAADFDVPIDAVSRRTILLEGPTYERIIAGRWKQKPGENYHPIWKLVAQMTFGLHLLARNLAKSEDEVMKILQNHVDDIDHVLERTAEDFDLAYSDMYERLRCLKLPLQHGEVFDRMLEDRTFRASILDGNEKIEHIVSRTKKALKDSMKDVQKGFDATNVLDTYLSGLSRTWQRDSPEHEAVYVAMLGNVEGWKRAFMDLHLQGNKVGGTLKKLMEIVSEMEKRAAAASRHQLVMSQGSMASIAQSAVGSRNSAKPLPVAPGRRSATRESSRNSNILRDVSSPFSNASQDRSSASSAQSRPYSGRQTPIHVLSSIANASHEEADEQDMQQQTPTIRQYHVESTPVELPADVPTEALRAAPVSKNNRLSYTLGLKPNIDDHRISSIYYPKALSDLLKIQHTPPILKSPQVATVKQESPHNNDGDYFSAHIRGSSITLVPVDVSKPQSAVVTPDKSTPSSAQRSPVIVDAETVNTGSRTPVISSPGLNSHAAVMSMATPPPPPVELPAANENHRREVTTHHRMQESRSSVGLLSSIGEPGPEVANSQYDGEDGLPADLPTIRIDEPDSSKRSKFNETDLSTRTKFISGIDLPETVVSALANHPEPVASESNVEQPGSQELLEEFYTPLERPTENESTTERPTSQEASRAEDNAALASPTTTETPTQKNFVAELEAEVPRDSVYGQQNRETVGSLAEMEALPAAHFILPSRASAIAIKVNAPPTKETRTQLHKARVQAREKEEAIKKEEAAKRNEALKTQGALGQVEILKPTGVTTSQGAKQRASVQDVVKPLRLRLAKRDGKMVAVEANSPGIEESERSNVKSVRLSTDVIATMLAQMSETPATSPETEHPSSGSAPMPAHKRFGRPESAPVPPSPSGRTMVTMDYATAGAFEGERSKVKASKRHSTSRISTMSGLRDLLTNATNRRHSTESVRTTVTNRNSMGSQPDGAKLLDRTTGVDVLWFKGGNKEKAAVPVGV